ncbi:MAG: sugar-binding protein [Gemmataceae bacterium]|nr:sugar-binding protein [Gemmataceae bacterium]
MKTLSAVAVAALSLLIGVSGCGKKDDKKTTIVTKSPPSANLAALDQFKTVEGKPHVAYVTNGIADFWRIAERGAEDGAAKFGVELDVRMPPKGVVDQKRMIEDLLARNVDGIAVSPINAENQTPFLKDVGKKTRLITHDSDAPYCERICYVGMDNYEAGRMCGQLVKKALPDGGSVIIFVGRLGQDNARLRRQGVIDELLGRGNDSSRYDEPGHVLKGDKYEIVDTRTDDFDFAKAKALAQDAIVRYPKLGCMVGLFEYNPPIMLDALASAGKLKAIKVVGFDENDKTLQSIKDGDAEGTIVQNPYKYGFESVRVLHALCQGDRSVVPASGFINIPARSITKANVDEFWTELKKLTGKN